MTKVHPNAAAVAASLAVAEEKREATAVASLAAAGEKREPVALTVWRRSLLFNGKGFTVFDSKGDLVFRVETYAGGSPREVVLMDADGRALLTICRKKLSLADEWSIMDGDAASAAPKRFTARRNMSLLPSKSLARLSSVRGASDRGDAPRYHVEGSYVGRSLDMFASASGGGGEQRRRVATVCRKEAAVGPDVFRLVVEPGFEPALAMAVVILLDQMYAS